jgi:hypothetical protein
VQGGSNIAAGVVWRFTTARDALHGGLRLHLTLDDRDVVGTVAYDSAGPPFHDGTLHNGPTQNAGRVGHGARISTGRAATSDSATRRP